MVEDEKFHVHRQILSLHSPVFKAMLSSDIKEKTATEIPLEGKKVAEVLDFLNLLYLRESEGISREYMCLRSAFAVIASASSRDFYVMITS